DGIRYGASVSGGNLLATYMRSRGEKLGAEVKRRIMLGTYALSAGYYEQYYVKAQKVRALLRKDFDQVFEKVDVIAGPVSPFLPFKIGEKVGNPLAMYLVDMYTVTLNLAGLPGLSVPAGSVQGLPVGLQLIAPAFQEQTLFETGKAFEKIRTF
ncbi:MAG: aspartyl-tRNA(Asn)/glutamyl-tRNA (Gln) amidotransferase subunit A, partial [Parcubacteria group bacterium Greene1014_47]